jgi:prolyl oligopeptidase PreP (S9A serine peptidase family)
MTPQSQYNKNILNNNQNQSQESQSSLVDTKTLEIVQAFKISKDSTDSSYFSVKSKHNVVSDFREYVTEHYGLGILTTLQKE